MEESKSICQQSPQITEHLSKTASTKATPGFEDSIEEVMQQVSLQESMELKDNQPPLIQPDSENEQKLRQYYEKKEPVREVVKS